MLERLDYMKLEPSRVLDAGSGPPQRLLGARYPRAEVVALDFSLAMLRSARSWREIFRQRLSVWAKPGRDALTSGSDEAVGGEMVRPCLAEQLRRRKKF